MSIGDLFLWLILLSIGEASNVSYNQPKLDPYAVWNTNALILTNSSIDSNFTRGLFVDTNDTIYVVDLTNNRVVVWLNNSVNPTITIYGNMTKPLTIFVATNGDMFISDFAVSNQTHKWSLNANSSTPVLSPGSACYGLFIDINNTLYCSLYFGHKIVKKWLGDNNASSVITVAGNGSSGSALNQLYTPEGIFVTTNFDLYVADYKNNRIQLFQPGQLVGTTIAGNSSINITITLNGPNAVILDVDNYLFITDGSNNRIIGSGPNGFRCIIGCSGSSGSEINQLKGPWNLAFDSHGNLYANEWSTNRILKYTLLNNTAVKSYNQPRLYADSTWNRKAITFADRNLIGRHQSNIFIDTNNSVYIVDRQNGRIQIWFNNTTNPTRTISADLLNANSIFVANNGDIYIDNGTVNGSVNKWTITTNSSIRPIMSIDSSCLSLFIDRSDTLYCSLYDQNKVVKKWLGDSTMIATTVAGNVNDTSGTSSYGLSGPRGIFVNDNFDLYVADSRNNRIQLFRLGQSNGITVAGKTSINLTITLNKPTGVTLDIDNYLYIVDGDNQRIVGSSRNGFRCIVGCSRRGWWMWQSSSKPVSMAFDSCGNIYVVDTGIDSIQTYSLSKTSCKQNKWITTAMIASTSNQSCSEPNVTLIPNASIISSPKQYRRSQDVSIVSFIEFNCDYSFTMITQWTIKNCTNISCTHSISLDPTINTKASELYIPANTLPYGIYNFTLTVTILHFSTVSYVLIEIVRSDIVVNLIQLGTPMITSGYQQNLIINPGAYSRDLDGYTFNASEWKYKYYCRIYGVSMFPQFQSSLLTIDDMRNDAMNPSCLSNRTGWKFDSSINSSLRILSHSFQSNRTYQFMVVMENIQNPSRQATGSVLVKVEETPSSTIAIGCVISTMCVAKSEYQLVNPSTQVALYSFCIEENCSTVETIQWKVYYGIRNTSTNITQWYSFNQTNLYENSWFFGTNTMNFTSTNQLFLTYSQWTFWRFEVVYTFTSGISSSSLDFLINQPPSNGSCSIDPLNGMTTTLFDLTCSDWFDSDGIKDYLLYIWTNDRSKQTLILYSSISRFQVQFPSGDEPTYEIHLIIEIRDEYDCLTTYNMTSPISIQPDSIEMKEFINGVQNTSNLNVFNNLFAQSLGSENQNVVGQVITLISNEFNKINDEQIAKAIFNGISSTSISISPLENSNNSQQNLVPLNVSALNEYKDEINSYAQVREYLIEFIPNLPITTSKSIQLQASAIVQLTKATNQLTRNTLTIAIDRCHQLTKTLYSLARQISPEDTYAAATQLIQCATNLLTAVNDVDFSRATSFPQDYDTDLELPWSNLNLFADGNDFSWSTIEKNRNHYYQQQLSNDIISKTNEMISLLTSCLNINLNVEQNFVVNTSQVFMLLERKSFQSLLNKQIKPVANAQINLPSIFQTNLNNNQTILIRSMMEPLSPAGQSQSNTNLSTSISLTILDDNGQDIPIKTSDNNSIEIIIPRDVNLIMPSMILYNVTSINTTDDYHYHHHQLFYYHYFNITTSLPISVHLEIHPLNMNLSYLLISRFDGIPQLNSSINQIDSWTLLCPSALTNQNVYTYFYDNQQTFNHHSLVIGLRELDSISYCSNSLFINQPPISDEMYNFTANYQLRVYTSGCYYLDNTNEWKADGLTVGLLTNHYQTQCYSKHLTKFTGSFNVLPQPVNWQYVFANADFTRNKTIYLTIICVSIIYIILIIYARHYDKKDLQKLGVTPLPDNHSSDQYYYQIIVFTGQRKDAGTKSNVHFILYGIDDQTSVRTFADPHRRILQRGGIDAFIMSVPKSLGLLNCIRIWHDNSGKSSASWFLKYLIIRDLQTMEKFHFIAQRWFAVEKDDGKIEHLLPVAGVTEKSDFSYILSKKAYHSISDGHLWFSIFSRPPSNRFTRVQRCTCCFNEAKMNASISFEQIIIGVIVEVFSLIPSLLLIQIFRRLRSRDRSLSPLRKIFYEINPSLIKEEAKTKTKKQPFTFPWWFIFITYGLCFLLVITSIFFLIVRGIEFGDVKTQKWLISILSGFFSSILFTQPLKIVALMIVFAFFCRKSQDDREAMEYLDENELYLDRDEEYLHDNNSLLIDPRPTIKHTRLTDTEVVSARQRRLKEIQMWSILRESFLYLIFFSTLSVLIYSQTQFNSFLQVDHLRKYLFNSRQSDLDYNQISSQSDYWSWLKESFAENIRAQQWYNDDPPRNLSGFMNDKTNRLLGWITMRQLRVKTHLCSPMRNLNFICQYDYNSQTEQTNSFDPGWIDQTQINSNSIFNQAFQYKSKDDLDTYPISGKFGRYGDGGYVYEFRGRLSDIQMNLTKLHEYQWIDDQTRAIIIQLSLYNPNAQLFTSIILLTEFLSTGGVVTQSTIESIQFYAFTSLSQLICLIIFTIFILYLIIKQIQLKWKAFTQFWSIIDIVIIICSWVGVGMYIWRYIEYCRIGKLFAKTNGYTYINLQLLTYINEIMRYMFSFCCFFGTIKFIRLCRYNYRVYLFIETLRIAVKELIPFSMMFSIVFLSFNFLFYFLFVSKLEACATFLQTTQMLFEMILMQFDGDGLVNAAAFLAPFCFSLFIFVVVFTCLSMFLTIVNQSFAKAKQNGDNVEHIYSFIFNRFLQWTGLKELDDVEKYDVSLRQEYFDPIIHFPEKMDQLLEALNQVYMSQKTEKEEIII
ncbi:hypothetical protein I4U23_011024 [Adineta vaga]|nr:hypothetical protein I4U23_011024 [Adineta vaga]